MSLLGRVWGGDAERKSRFHTRRGDLMPLREIARLPLYVARRLGGAQRGPWMAAGAVRWLDDNLSPEMTLLEFGSGRSTIWYGARVGRVVSVEPDPVWHSHVVNSAQELTNVEIVEGSIRSAAARLQDTPFDVVVIDHLEGPGDLNRIEVLECVGPSTSVVILDDSDRAHYREADRIMSGWEHRRFCSYRDRPLSPTETTIFTRNVASDP